jgi:spore germination protein
VVLVETSIMMIGMNEIVNQNNALISAIRQIQLPFLNFFERVDIAYLTVGFMGLFAGKTIMLLSVVEFACKLLPRVKRIYIVVAACAAVFVSDIIILNTKNFGEDFEVFAIYTGTVAVIGIPAILFILAKVKKHAHKMG